jgi:CHAD domain-containing protein
MKQSRTLHSFVLERTAVLVGRVAFEANQARKSCDADTIHDLRVSIRRLSEALRMFGAFFPQGQGKRVRKRLRKIMRVTADIRSRDIAVELLEESGTGSKALKEALVQDRKRAQRRLARALRRWHARDYSARWRESLELSAE